MVQETISGFKKEGSWEEVVRHGERISSILERHVEGNDFTEWEEWRPREDEDFDDEVTEKTVKKASVNPVGEGFRKKSRQVFRGFEEAVYRKIVSKTNPLYFDNELVSANIEKKSSISSSEYIFEVKVHPRSLRENVRKYLN